MTSTDAEHRSRVRAWAMTRHVVGPRTRHPQELIVTSHPHGSGGASPVTIQRIEGGLIAAVAMIGTIVLAPGLWWFPLAVFLAFDLSMAGYLRSPSAGALWYNALHTYVWPAVLVAGALVTSASAATLSLWLALTGLAWAFHVGVDRMLGYGLKLPDEFTHTHLGRIGKSDGRLADAP